MYHRSSPIYDDAEAHEDLPSRNSNYIADPRILQIVVHIRGPFQALGVTCSPGCDAYGALHKLTEQ